MRFIVKRYLLTVASIFILTQLISAFLVSDLWYGLFYSAIILTLLLYVVRPIFNLVMLPINLVTLNFSSWIVYIAIFYLWILLVPQIKISAWQFPGVNFGPITLAAVNLVQWQVTIITGIALNFLSKLIDWIFK